MTIGPIIGELLKLVVLAGLGVAGVIVILGWKKDLTRKVSYLRFLVQAVSVVTIFYLFTIKDLWLFGLLAVILLMPIVLGRFFCGWICPFGFYSDLITQVRKALKINHRNLPEGLNRNLNKLRYVIFLVILALPFLLGIPADMPSSWILYFVGPFRPLNILLGQLEPLIIPWKGFFEFGGVNLSYPYIREIGYYTTGTIALVSVIILISLTVAGSFLLRRFWCRFCPMGVSVAIVNRFKAFKWAPLLHLNKDEEKCTKCGICKRVCPLQVTEVYEKKGGDIGTSMCMQCARCVEMCPYEGCLKMKIAGKTVFKSRNWLEPSKNY